MHGAAGGPCCAQRVVPTVLSLPDMAILGVLALLVFGEQKLPGIMRQAGRVMREVQNTSASFVREMERAADVNEPVKPAPAPFEEVQVIDEPPPVTAAPTDGAKGEEPT